MDVAKNLHLFARNADKQWRFQWKGEGLRVLAPILLITSHTSITGGEYVSVNIK